MKIEDISFEDIPHDVRPLPIKIFRVNESVIEISRTNGFLNNEIILESNYVRKFNFVIICIS